MDAHKKVMFVDDEEGVRISWNRYLSDYGFEVTTAEDGAKAISLLRDEPVDVVVSDLKMPGIDGVELLEWLHDRRPETRFILLTGYGNEDVEQRVRELGAFEYLNKPISPDTLAAVVTAATHLNLIDTTDSAPELSSEIMEIEGPAVRPDETVEEAMVKPEASPDVTNAPKSRIRASLEIVGGLIAAPILGLAFVIFLPIIGFGATLWMLGERLWHSFKPAT